MVLQIVRDKLALAHEVQGTRQQEFKMDAVYLAMIAGSGTILGALIPIWAPKITSNGMAFSFALTAGVMLTVSALTIGPAVIGGQDKKLSTTPMRDLYLDLMWFLLGGLVYFFLRYTLYPPPAEDIILEQLKAEEEQNLSEGQHLLPKQPGSSSSEEQENEHEPRGDVSSIEKDLKEKNKRKNKSRTSSSTAANIKKQDRVVYASPDVRLMSDGLESPMAGNTNTANTMMTSGENPQDVPVASTNESDVDDIEKGTPEKKINAGTRTSAAAASSSTVVNRRMVSAGAEGEQASSSSTFLVQPWRSKQLTMEHVDGFAVRDRHDGEATDSKSTVAETIVLQQRSWRLALLMFVSLLAHNFPEGLAVAAGGQLSDKVGATVAAAVFFHNIPEGLAIAVPCLAAFPDRPWLAFSLASASGLAEPVGALISIFCIQEVQVPVSLVLAFAAGLMCALSMFELLPEAMLQEKRGFGPSCGPCVGFLPGPVVVSGLAAGVVMMVSTEVLMNQVA
ncbi:unnamed protein product [Amoebophrya sp. A120]|nr:unnamed protein product [Amoebophrya sp. A120]|eukprot:GSA120T00008086001.1